MNLWEMIVIVVAITAVASVLKARYGIVEDAEGNEVVHRPDPDAARLKDEVKALKERIAVLERLATDDNSARALDREIEKLR